MAALSLEQGLRLTAVTPARAVASMADDMREGLSLSPKVLHPKYFYDELGSQLFDQICDTPEYYLTRVESELLAANGRQILCHTSPANIVELGSGASRKSRILLELWDAPDTATYLPFDVSEEMLTAVSQELAADFDGLSIHGLVGDYTAGLEHLPKLEGPSLWMFIGSTLGNFEPSEAQAFVGEIAEQMSDGDSFLLGTDLDKSETLLEPAYNDAQGLTARFNLNILAAVNDALNADFDPQSFSHLAYYCQARRRIEMHLVSEANQQVAIDDLELKVAFAKGERMRTEISRKFLVEEIQAMLEAAGLEMVESFCHEKFPYALTLARKNSA